MKSKASYPVAFVFVLSFFVGTAWGQVTASITGTVKDTSGAVVPGAAITVRHVETGTTRTAETDGNGNYTVPSLPVGQYEVSVEKEGFKRQVRSGITLVIAQQAVLNLSLEVGAVTQQVTVTGEAPLVNTTLAPTSGLVGEKEVKDLPLNGRSFDQLLTLNVGTINSSSNRSPIQPGNLFSVAGRRPEENRFLMNGIDYIGASGGANTSTPNGSNGQVMGVDAVREFNVVSHTYGAEWGKRAGGQISIVTTSGTNQLHGSAFEYLRNSVFDARNFFDYPDQVPGGGRIPGFKRNQFGGTLGGPVKRDKGFLFGNYEGYRQRLGISAVSVVPDNNARQGLLPCNVVYTTAADRTANCPNLNAYIRVPNLKPGMLPFANTFWPTPNGEQLTTNGLLTGAAFSYANPVQRVRDDFGLLRGDYNVSSKDSISANYVMQDGENIYPAATGNPNFAQVIPLRSQLISLQETHTFSPTVLNVVTAGYSRAHIIADAVATVPIPAELSFISGAPPGSISIGGGVTGATRGSITVANGHAGPVTYVRNFFTYADDLHVIRGSHSLSAGVWVQKVQSNRNGSGASFSTVAYGSLLTFLTDAPSSFTAIPSRTMLGFRSTEAAWYIQDEIKLKPNLTLRLGLRDEMTTGFNEVRGRCSNPIFDQNGVVQTEPSIGHSCLLENHAIALWQPRIGVAWDPTGTGTWAVRAGFGIYNTLQDNLDQAFGTSVPFNAQVSFTRPMLEVIPIPGGTPAPPSCSPTRGQPCSIFQPGQIDPTLHTPTIQDWSLTIEREVTKDLVLQLGYVGSQSYHLEVGVDANTVRPQVCANPQGCLSGGILPAAQRETVPQGTTYVPPGTRQNPYLGRTFERAFFGTSSYHALTVSLVKRLSAGLAFKANYSFSKVLDLNSQLDSAYSLNAPSDILNPYNTGLNKGPATFDLRQQFNLNFGYELPLGRGKRWGGGASGWVDKLISGWQWNGIVQVQPGFPFTPTVGSNRSGTGDTNNPDVPNRNPAFSGPVIRERPDHWFDPNAFLLPAAGTFGNAGRNQFRGPDLRSFDTSLFKRIPINERWNAQFRAEVFNLLNRANFGPPILGVFSGTSLSPSAGVISTTSTSSRQIQFALKLTF